MKNFILKGGLGLLLLIALAGQALAVDISASHQILSVQPTANGNDITINLIISNISTQNINNLSVVYNDPIWQIDADTTLPIKVAYIATAASLANVWQLNTGLSTFDGTLPLALHLFYIDAAGTPVDIDITSVAE